MKIDTKKIGFWYWWSAGLSFTWILGFILTGIEMSSARIAFWIITVCIMLLALLTALICRLEKKS